MNNKRLNEKLSQMQKGINQLRHRKFVFTLQPNQGASILEVLSWIASIVSMIIGILVWLVPSPTNFTLLFSSSTKLEISNIIKLLLFSVIFGVGMSIIAQKIIGKPNQKRKIGTMNALLTIEGDWSNFGNVALSLAIIFTSSVLAMIAIYLKIFLCTLPTIALFGVGFYWLVSSAKIHRNYLSKNNEEVLNKGMSGSGKINLTSDIEWLSTVIRPVIIIVLFSLLLVVIMAVKLSGLIP